MHLSMHLSCTCIALANIANNSSNGRPDAALKDTLHGGVNVAFEGAPLSSKRH